MNSTIPAGTTAASFYLTPEGSAGDRSLSITTSPALTYTGSPLVFDAAASYQPQPTIATLTGPTTGLDSVQSAAFTVGLDQPAQSGGVTVTPGSTGVSDTFQATPGGGNVSSVSIPSGSTSTTFYLTTGGLMGNRGISISTSPTPTYVGSPLTYDATTSSSPPLYLPREFTSFLIATGLL